LKEILKIPLSVNSVTVGSIERKLPRSTWDQWIERGGKGHIVILDKNTKFTDIKPESKIQCLKDAIYLYDTSCTLKSEPLFLDGGYEAWVWHYPSLVTNPKLLPEVSIT
jgi:ubiquitin carboxyl-terminal hydrolase 8